MPNGVRNKIQEEKKEENGLMARTVVGFDEPSLSNRLEMEPLAVQDELPGWLLDFDSGVADVPGAPIYMAALPFPGRAGGIRFTTTEEDLGIICESSLSSARIRGCEDMSATNGYVGDGTDLLQTSHRIQRGQSRWIFQGYWRG
jgi:hypothetical protein